MGESGVSLGPFHMLKLWPLVGSTDGQGRAWSSSASVPRAADSAALAALS